MASRFQNRARLALTVERPEGDNEAKALRITRIWKGELNKMETYSKKQLTSWAGMVGSALFVVIIILQDLLRPGFHWVRTAASEHLLGPYGWIQTAKFIVVVVYFGWVFAFALMLNKHAHNVYSRLLSEHA